MGSHGREEKRENDLFFVCSVIECIGRSMNLTRADVVRKLGKSDVARLLELADILHCEPVETTADGLIEKHAILTGNFDNVSLCKYSVPTLFDIAKVYKRLIVSVADTDNIPLSQALIKVYTSFISEKIDDYNSSMYYENPQYLYESYIAGEVIE